jgi:hypothetical protein
MELLAGLHVLRIMARLLLQTASSAAIHNTLLGMLTKLGLEWIEVME